MSNGRRVVLVAAAVVAAGVWGACTGDRPVASAPRAEPDEAAQAAFVAAKARLPHGRASAAWVGELHTDAMIRWMRGRREFAHLSAPAACARAVQLARALAPDVRQATGHAGEALDALYERAVASSSVQSGCSAPAAPLSIWSALSGAPSPAAGDGDTVTGAYEAFIPQLETALNSALSPAQVTAAADQVLSRASTLPQPDFEVLAAIAALETSSAWYWYTYGGDGAGAGGAQMSLFVQDPFSWLGFAAADLAGGIAGLRLARGLGAIHPYLLAAAFFGGAAIGSAIYAYRNMQ